MRDLDLHTVCEEAHCPNVGECWEHGTATFMILGDVCTRNCAYCAVAHGRPPKFDSAEPERVAEAATVMKLQHVVLTSVDRDDLPDFGAWAFAETIRQIKLRSPSTSVEVLVPDFQGKEDSIRAVLEAEPDIYNHNTETVPRLYKKCRPGGRYERVMNIFTTAKRLAPHIPTKTGIILGMGETNEEIVEVMKDLRAVDVDILTLGCIWCPSDGHIALDPLRHAGRLPPLLRNRHGAGLPSRGERPARALELSRVGAGASRWRLAALRKSFYSTESFHGQEKVRT